MSFQALNLARPLLRAIADAGYATPTPIQQKAIGPIAEGKDLLGIAQTGTGKTAAFALPTLDRLLQAPRSGKRRPVRALVLVPTRELAAQVGQSFVGYGRHTDLRSVTVFGGVGQGPQVDALRRGVDIMVATPGRLLDLIAQGHARLGDVEVFVLDEADRMFDMGFLPDVRRVAGCLPEQRQTLLFSATMPPDIRKLADDLLSDPVTISVAPAATPAEKVKQSLYFVEKRDKSKLLLHLLSQYPMPRVLVFTRTKHGADNVARKLSRVKVRVGAIHGNKTQGQRVRALEQFREGRLQMLVATDIASRGLDIDDVSHVVNFDLPNESESYVHRIGRTARAGAGGEAIAFCSSDEFDYLRDIEKLMRLRIDVVDDHPFHTEPAAAAAPAVVVRPAPPRRRRRR